jgi:hypothetical protein
VRLRDRVVITRAQAKGSVDLLSFDIIDADSTVSVCTRDHAQCCVLQRILSAIAIADFRHDRTPQVGGWRRTPSAIICMHA